MLLEYVAFVHLDIYILFDAIGLLYLSLLSVVTNKLCRVPIIWLWTLFKLPY